MAKNKSKKESIWTLYSANPDVKPKPPLPFYLGRIKTEVGYRIGWINPDVKPKPPLGGTEELKKCYKRRR